MPIQKLVSGGQTGVDRAALDVALELGIPCGGWCPRGRLAEDGRIPDRYPLQETKSDDYSRRTLFNVRDSDGTLILTRGELTGGTALTKSLADERGKPCHVVDLDVSNGIGDAADWLKSTNIRIVNVAGPRESVQPGIHEMATEFLRNLLAEA